jgi:hypothetical protein
LDADASRRDERIVARRRHDPALGRGPVMLEVRDDLYLAS